MALQHSQHGRKMVGYKNETSAKQNIINPMAIL